jgi:putative ABC transport system ATP-binding protein
MLKLNKELNTTFIFSTHDPKVIDYLKRVIKLTDGEVERDDLAAGV